MGVKFSSIVFLILAIFIVKISLENFGSAQAQETHKLNSSNDFQQSRIKTAKK